MNSREIIIAARKEVRDAKNLQPERAADLLLELTSLLGIINDEIRTADMEYAEELGKNLAAEEKANRAKIKSETSPQYLRKREARDTKEEAIELIRSIKYYLKAEQYEP